MKRPEVALGLALLLSGLLFLLERMGFPLARPLWGGGMALAGAVLLAMGLRDRTRFLWVIPGGALLGLGAWLGGNFGGVSFLGLTGLGFLLAYVLRPSEWWVLIPGGVLLTLALVALVEALWPDLDAARLLFLGFAATFGVLFALGHRWALWPALGLLVPLAFWEGVEEALGYLFPFALVFLGGWLLWRGLTGRA